MKQRDDGTLEYDGAAHAIEKRALTGDRTAALQVVSALRRYRAASIDLLNKRSLGNIDRHEVNLFGEHVQEIEDDLATS